jgi:hypothetical protein
MRKYTADLERGDVVWPQGKGWVTPITIVKVTPDGSPSNNTQAFRVAAMDPEGGIVHLWATNRNWWDMHTTS